MSDVSSFGGRTRLAKNLEASDQYLFLETK